MLMVNEGKTMGTKSEGNGKSKVCANCKRYDGMGCYTHGIWNKLEYEYTNPQSECIALERFKPKDGDEQK